MKKSEDRKIDKKLQELLGRHYRETLEARVPPFPEELKLLARHGRRAPPGDGWKKNILHVASIIALVGVSLWGVLVNPEPAIQGGIERLLSASVYNAEFRKKSYEQFSAAGRAARERIRGEKNEKRILDWF